MKQDKCRSCGAAIIWCRTAKTGKLMPVDAEPFDGGNIHLDENGVAHVDSSCLDFGGPHYRSHFATCPNAAKHRRKP